MSENKARFILDLDADTWSALHSSLCAAVMMSDTDIPAFTQTIESLEKQALNMGIMNKEQLIEWRAAVMESLKFE